MVITSLIIFKMECQIKKENKETQTDYTLFNWYPEEEKEELPRLDDGQIIFYESEDPFLQDYFNSYNKWIKDGERFLKEEFIGEYISSGKAPALKDGRPEIDQWFKYTIENNIFLVGWGSLRVNAKEFIEKMLNIYKEHGNIPETLSSNSRAAIRLANWVPIE